MFLNYSIWIGNEFSVEQLVIIESKAGNKHSFPVLHYKIAQNLTVRME